MADTQAYHGMEQITVKLQFYHTGLGNILSNNDLD
jgi:hypothetical protein